MKPNSAGIIELDWPVSNKVKAYCSTRQSFNEFKSKQDKSAQSSQSNYDHFNLATHVADDLESVIRNRKMFKQQLNLPATPAWLEQVHSTELIDLNIAPVESKIIPVADGSFTTEENKICCVMTADCLPVLLTNQKENWVAAVHAGWRGLADGIIQNALASRPKDGGAVLAWLGPAISQKHFEVGEEVKQVFSQSDTRFIETFKPLSSAKYLADLYKIASIILKDAGAQVYGGESCTFEQTDYFYSYRRDGVCGRMASLIWIDNKTL